LCGWKGWTYFPFVHNIYIRRGAICPGCGAVERHRAFALLLQQELKSLSPGRVLEVGPRSAFRLIFEKAGWKYLSLDIEPKFADVQGDVQNLPFSDGEFDGIICFHVLEHVPDDRKALREMRRCLKTGGVLFLAVPWFKDSATQEFDGPDPLLHGHVRRYGYDVKDRITEAGFQAELKDCGAGLSDKELQWWGIAGTAARGNVFICH
jgi:SAM-dependent methyltransferase